MCRLIIKVLFGVYICVQSGFSSGFDPNDLGEVQSRHRAAKQVLQELEKRTQHIYQYRAPGRLTDLKLKKEGWLDVATAYAQDAHNRAIESILMSPSKDVEKYTKDCLERRQQGYQGHFSPKTAKQSLSTILKNLRTPVKIKKDDNHANVWYRPNGLKLTSVKTPERDQKRDTTPERNANILRLLRGKAPYTIEGRNDNQYIIYYEAHHIDQRDKSAGIVLLPYKIHKKNHHVFHENSTSQDPVQRSPFEKEKGLAYQIFAFKELCKWLSNRESALQNTGYGPVPKMRAKKHKIFHYFDFLKKGPPQHFQTLSPTEKDQKYVQSTLKQYGFASQSSSNTATSAPSAPVSASSSSASAASSDTTTDHFGFFFEPNPTVKVKPELNEVSKKIDFNFDD